MSSTIPFTGRRACTRSIQRPLRSASAERLAAWVSTSVSNRPIWLVEAACSATARPPTTQRMAGSCASRSASFTSSYPAKRPNTDWRNCPTRVWRPFAPVRVSVRTSPAVSLRQRASSSSRQASRPPSDVTFVPWNSSLRRRSNVRPSTAVCGSPNVASIRGTRYRPYPADNLSRTDAYCQCQTKVSGKCGLRWLQAGDCAVSRGLGRVQVAILDHLHARRGDNHIGGPGEPLFILGPGIHDMRHVAEEMTRQRGFSEPRLQAVFSRAVRRLVERGHL